MIAEGLLWFDDDSRRPLIEKIANAVERYSERTGWQATVCEAHPTQVELFNAERERAAAAAARRRAPSAKQGAAPAIQLPERLRVTPNVAIRPNCFFIGIEAGERPRKAPAQPTAHAASRKASRAASVAEAPAAADGRAKKVRAKAS